MHMLMVSGSPLRAVFTEKPMASMTVWAAMGCAEGSESPVHDEGIDVPVTRMSKCLRQASDDLEAKVLPQTNGSFVGTDDKVELDRTVAAGSCEFKRVSTHGSGDSTASSPGWAHSASALS